MAGRGCSGTRGWQQSPLPRPQSPLPRPQSGGNDDDINGKAMTTTLANGNGSFQSQKKYDILITSYEGRNGARILTTIVEHVKSGAWNGTSATASATAVVCSNNAEVLDGLLGVLDAQGIVFGRDHAEDRRGKSRRRRKPRGPKPDGRDRDKTGNTEALPPFPPPGTKKASIPLCTLLLFLGAQRPALDVRARRTPDGVPSQPGSASRELAAAAAAAVGWSTADDQVLEETIIRAGLELERPTTGSIPHTLTHLPSYNPILYDEA
ncbi:hypothetical protein EDB84DRAFT_1558957 [Lactarius hengduanensis]|nr:hypothetical protein EDB84DRAFT_1558957 [Lactarius hengduanensis]